MVFVKFANSIWVGRIASQGQSLSFRGTLGIDSLADHAEGQLCRQAIKQRTLSTQRKTKPQHMFMKTVAPLPDGLKTQEANSFSS